MGWTHVGSDDSAHLSFSGVTPGRWATDGSLTKCQSSQPCCTRMVSVRVRTMARCPRDPRARVSGTGIANGPVADPGTLRHAGPIDEEIWVLTVHEMNA